MTLGCGSPGGNITSDNIGPQHLMNLKRVAWESRPVEHRTIPADQRLIAMPIPMHKSAAAVGAALRAARVSPSEIAPPASTSESSQSFAPPVQRGDSAAAPSFASSAKGGDSDSGVRQGTAFHPEERRLPLSSERAAVPKSDAEKGALAPGASRPEVDSLSHSRRSRRVSTRTRPPNNRPHRRTSLHRTRHPPSKRLIFRAPCEGRGFRICFTSGHGFSRAETGRGERGFSP